MVISLTRRVFESSVVAVGTTIGGLESGESRAVHEYFRFPTYLVLARETFPIRYPHGRPLAATGMGMGAISLGWNPALVWRWLREGTARGWCCMLIHEAHQFGTYCHCNVYLFTLEKIDICGILANEKRRCVLGGNFWGCGLWVLGRCHWLGCHFAAWWEHAIRKRWAGSNPCIDARTKAFIGTTCAPSRSPCGRKQDATLDGWLLQTRLVHLRTPPPSSPFREK